LAALLRRFPGFLVEPARQSAGGGRVFRKPPTLHVVW